MSWNITKLFTRTKNKQSILPKPEETNKAVVTTSTPSAPNFTPANYFLSEIHQDLRVFTSSLQELARTSNISILNKPIIDSSLLYDRLSDAISVICSPKFNSINIQRLSFEQIVSDLAENYAARYGGGYSHCIRIHVQPGLPYYKADPQLIYTLLERLMRAAKGRLIHDTVDITIKSNTKVSDDLNQTVVINVTGRRLPFEKQQMERILSNLKVRQCSEALHVMGTEFTAALLNALALDAEIKIVNSSSHGHYELKLKLAEYSDNDNIYKIPEILYLYSTNADTISAFEKFAKYFDCPLEIIKNLAQINTDLRLIFDATTYDQSEIINITKNKLPNDSIIILPPDAWQLRDQLAASGLQYFTSIPFVSNHFISSTKAIYEQQSETVYKKPESKLRSVLIVDDAPTSRILLANYLFRQGYTISEAANGLELINLIKAGVRYDAIFCDLNMPELGGKEAVQLVRQYEKDNNLSRTPIALMTAYTDDSAKLRAEHSEFDEFLTKPVDLQIASNFLHGVLKNQVANIAQSIKQNTTQTNTADAGASTEIIDLDDLKSRCSGKNDLVIAVLEGFLDASQQQLYRLESVTVKNNQLELLRCMHTLKGMLRDIAARELADNIQALELKVAHATPEEMTVLQEELSRIHSSCVTVQSEIRSLIPELSQI